MSEPLCRIFWSSKNISSFHVFFIFVYKKCTYYNMQENGIIYVERNKPEKLNKVARFSLSTLRFGKSP